MLKQNGSTKNVNKKEEDDFVDYLSKMRRGGLRLEPTKFDDVDSVDYQLHNSSFQRTCCGFRRCQLRVPEFQRNEAIKY